MYGMYPNELHWRINSAFILVIGLGFAGYFFKDNLKKYLALYYVIIYPLIAFLVIYYLISGGSFGLQWVETGAWGGLSLTFIVSFFCLIFCFPLGMIFALGRRSNLPVIKYISICYIEFWRGVPLITVLFMSSVMFPMFLPEDFFMDKLVRVIIAITLFEASNNVIAIITLTNLSIKKSSGRNIGNITDDMNSTVINGTPLQNSI